MIRADLASRVPPAIDLAPRPALPTEDLTDKLAGLAVGQRVLAQIESPLPNGTYRALINQRNLTLALPFAARAGDVIELQVTESNGRLALAVATATVGEAAPAAAEAATATLSRTGQLIGQLLAGGAGSSAEGTAMPLNGNRPIAAVPPRTGEEMLALLARAIVDSGMFYESHQAEWVGGRYSKERLLGEPQGKLGATGFSSATHGVAPRAPAEASAAGARLAGSAGAATAAGQAAAAGAVGPPVAPPLQPLVQQQLEALATQNFTWQGQVWPGQQIEWQIESPDRRRQESSEVDDERWQTRLHLTLPGLGEIDARLRISGRHIVIALGAGSESTRALLREEAAALRGQFERAGIELAAFAVGAAAGLPAATGGPHPASPPPIDDEQAGAAG